MTIAGVARFLARPRFRETRTSIDAAGLAHLLALFGMTVLGVIILSGLVWPIILSSMDGEMPSNSNDALLDMNPARLILVAIVLAPLLEEIIFRSWLGGRRTALLGFPMLASGLALLSLLGSGVGATTGLAVASVLTFLTLTVWRRARTLDEGAFIHAREQLFPFIFWGTAILFGLLHLANYQGGITTPLLMLAVTPQMFVGLVLGYVRLRFGLVTAICFHGGYNAVLISMGLFLSGLNSAAMIVW